MFGSFLTMFQNLINCCFDLFVNIRHPLFGGTLLGVVLGFNILLVCIYVLRKLFGLGFSVIEGHEMEGLREKWFPSKKSAPKKSAPKKSTPKKSAPKKSGSKKEIPFYIDYKKK